MSWIKPKDAPTTPVRTPAATTRPRHGLHLDPQTELRLAHFLAEHGRTAIVPGRRPMLMLLGSCHHDDGSIDYSIRTRVRQLDGTERRYDSHLRVYPERIRLIR